MKDTIEFYYDLKIDNIYLDNNIYHFEIDKNEYYFVYFNRPKDDIENILIIINELVNKNIPVHKIIFNNKNEPITNIDEVPYVLLKIQNKNEEYSILDMLKYSKTLTLVNSKNGLYRDNWAKLWEIKNDYIENQLQEIKISDLLHNSIDYYLGLSESAICFVNNVSEKYYLSSADKIVLSRKRIEYPNYNLNYFNPLAFIFDLEVRDVAEYLKSMFFKGEDAFFELDLYLKTNKLTIYGYNMLFARLLYPSYYFDLYEKIVNYNEKPDQIIEIIAKEEEYEQFLKKAYKQISLYAPLENIEYLKS